MYVVIPMLLGITILKEPFSFKKLLGLLCAVAAIYFLSSAEHEHPEVPIGAHHHEEGLKQRDPSE
jgi:drug/metabolite transporter (DMT)-like permease